MEMYRQLPAPPPLREYVTILWEVFNGRDGQEVALPQGTIDIIFNFTGTVNGAYPHTHILA